MDLRRLFNHIRQLFHSPHATGRIYPTDGTSPGPWNDASYPGNPNYPDEAGAYEQGQGPVPGWPTLTARELEVAWYLQQGMSNEAIANQLGISIATVKTHVHNLLVKFNVRSRWVLYEVLRNAPFDPWDQP